MFELVTECNYTSIPLHSSKYLSSQEWYFRSLTVFWFFNVFFFNVLTLQFFLPEARYRPSTHLFWKIGYEILMEIFMIYAKSEYEDKERSLEHVQPDMQNHNILAWILECQIRHPSIREFKSGIDLLIEITHGLIETAIPIRGWERLRLFSVGLGWT